MRRHLAIRVPRLPILCRLDLWHPWTLLAPGVEICLRCDGARLP